MPRVALVTASHHCVPVLVALKLILARPLARIEDIAQRDVIFARVDEDQEGVARLIGKYDLIAIPVVDANDMLVGIITHDDAMDILRQEQTEDILAFGGVSKDSEADDESYWQGRVHEAVRRRRLRDHARAEAENAAGEMAAARAIGAASGKLG